MSFFYVWNLNLSKRKPFLILSAIVVILAFFLWFNRTNLFPIAQENMPAVFTKGNKDHANISLTFNISWGDEKIYDILSVLEKEKTVPTFFLRGEWAERHPEIIEKILEQKHEIGMLGYRYKSYLDQDLQRVRQDLYLAQDAFRKLGLESIRLLRAPKGHLNEEIIELAKNLGFTVIHWNVNPNDWENPGTEEIIQTVLDDTKRGDIILLHASDSAKQTSKALESILPGLTKKGFNMVTVSELISQVETDAKLIH